MRGGEPCRDSDVAVSYRLGADGLTVTTTARNLFTNHFNHLVETDLDLPAAPEL
ncbi:MAG: hypothetical protein M3500_11250 [Actinomycetota bacterium]|nr:hypothetical protein [Actinomycetota bacterium]